MQLYEVITHMTTTFGLTFDEAVGCMVWFLLAFVGGISFMFQFAFDISCFLYRGVRRLLRAALCTLRRLLKVHFKK